MREFPFVYGPWRASAAAHSHADLMMVHALDLRRLLLHKCAATAQWLKLGHTYSGNGRKHVYQG